MFYHPNPHDLPPSPPDVSSTQAIFAISTLAEVSPTRTVAINIESDIDKLGVGNGARRRGKGQMMKKMLPVKTVFVRQKAI